MLCPPLGGIALLGVHGEKSLQEESMHVRERCVQ